MRKPILKADVLKAADGNVHVRLIDIRSADEYEKMHVPGAINIPAEELESNMQSFSSNDTIVCVCNHGKERSQKAAELLYNAGLEMPITYPAAQQHGLMNNCKPLL